MKHALKNFPGAGRILRSAGTAAACAFIIFAIFANPASAKTELDEPGGIAVIAKDELGNPLQGFTARIVLPYDDGKLYFGMDITATKTDGTSDDDLEKMERKTGDGDVEMNSAAASRCVRGGEEFEVTVQTPGLVDAVGKFTYATDQVNVVTIKQEYILKVEAVDADGEPAKGFSATAGGNFVTDGSIQDMDMAENGIIYFSEDVLNGEREKEIEVAASHGGVEAKGLFTVSSRARKPVRFVFAGEKEKDEGESSGE